MSYTSKMIDLLPSRGNQVNAVWKGQRNGQSSAFMCNLDVGLPRSTVALGKGL